MFEKNDAKKVVVTKIIFFRFLFQENRQETKMKNEVTVEITVNGSKLQVKFHIPIS